MLSTRLLSALLLPADVRVTYAKRDLPVNTISFKSPVKMV